MIIIGLGSTTGFTSGKSTTAQILKELLDEERCIVLRESFANLLKTIGSRLIVEILTLPRPDDKELVLPKLGITYREFLVELSCILKETLGEDVWVDALSRDLSSKYGDVYPTNAVVIIDDVRYSSEVKWIRSWSNNLLFNVVDETFSEHPRIDVGDLESTDFDAPIQNPKTIIGLVRNIQHTALPMILSKLAGPT